MKTYKLCVFPVLLGLIIFFVSSGFANTPRLRGAFLRVEGLQARRYLIKVHYTESNGMKDYDYPVNLEDGKVYVHPRPADTKAIIKIVPQTEDFVARSPYSISNRELNKKWHNSKGKDYFDSHNFKLESKTGVPIESISDSPDLFKPDPEIPCSPLKLPPKMLPQHFEEIEDPVIEPKKGPHAKEPISVTHEIYPEFRVMFKS